MRVRRLSTPALLFAAGVSILVGALGVGLALPADERSPAEQIASTASGGAEIVAPDRRSGPASGRAVELLAPLPTVLLTATSALALVAAGLVAHADLRGPGRVRRFLSRSLRSPPRSSILPHGATA